MKVVLKELSETVEFVLSLLPMTDKIRQLPGFAKREILKRNYFIAGLIVGSGISKEELKKLSKKMELKN